MGQSVSSQREREDFLQRDSRRFSQLVRDRVGSENAQSGTTSAGGRLNSQVHTLSAPAPGFSHQQESQATTPFATFSRQISAQSIPAGGGVASTGDTTTRDSIFYEQHEERPLVHMEELGMRDAPITHITATPLPRRATILSRIGSRLIHRNIRTQAADTVDSYAEASRPRRRLSRSSSTRNADHRLSVSNHRLSMLGSLSSATANAQRSRRRGEMASISPPIPIAEDNALPPATFASSAIEDPLSEGPTTPAQGSDMDNYDLLPPRSSRLSRIRRSLSSPLDTLLATRLSALQQVQTNGQPQISSRYPVINDPGYVIPPLTATDHSLDLHGQSSHLAAQAAQEHGNQGFSAVPEGMEHSNPRADGPRWAERWTERASATRRESRRMPSMLRGRSSRMIRRDDEGPLPRILHLAAAAIAAQLSGTPEQAFNNTQAIGAEGLDGSLATLFRTLQLATASTTDFRGPEVDADMARLPGSPAPLNFLRVFRFVGTNPTNGPNNGATGDRSSTRARPEDEPEDAHLDGSDGRIVTLVMVGVRSVPSDHVADDALHPEPTLDALLNLPNGPASNIIRHGSGNLLRHADGRSRFPRRRRASMGGVNQFPANYDSQRHQRMHSGSRQGSADTTAVSGSAVPLALSESPPGPHPPPSTPADPGLSAYSSGATTPNRRPSSASAMQYPPLPGRDIASQHLREAGILTSEDRAMHAVQQRRRSDSEFARQRDLGSGASRRNGVVEPDDVEAGDPAPQGSRSWLIYVVGTNLSEDHPAFATPSLFTDNPTYEDMLLLSSLLGPAKPPVASREDVASAPGVYTIVGSSTGLIASAVHGSGRLQLAQGERCLVCLSDYEQQEEIRQLSKCNHVFHRQCIDEDGIPVPCVEGKVWTKRVLPGHPAPARVQVHDLDHSVLLKGLVFI